jgi:hypothetical protein
MKSKLFGSSNHYLYLPTKRSAKVILAVDNSKIAVNSFKLYNPFSTKAKLLKLCAKFLFVYLNPIMLFFLKKSEGKSDLIAYLEGEFNNKIVSSIYVSTIGDKVVLQLQTETAEVIGYLKCPLNKVGLQHLENEKNALKILSSKKIVKPYITYDNFDGYKFIVLRELSGEIGLVDRGQLDELLTLFHRDTTFCLQDHPRIVELRKQVCLNSKEEYVLIIDNICSRSQSQFALVYEHGDFAPWNIINNNGECYSFDLEHFIEDGIECFDLIKYYYQTGRLLKRLDCSKLVVFIQENIISPDISDLLKLFLIKEVLVKIAEGEGFSFEEQMLEYMEQI